jgi:tRNA U55 pseudouridine synthase TruB
VPALTEASLVSVLSSFEGDRMQRPPAYSAVKVKGKRLYKYAREGKPVKAEPRPIHIQTMALTGFTERTIDVNITCSRGTYVRVIAQEVAEALGTVGHLGALRRASSGPFSLENALGFTELSRLVADREDWQAVLRPARGEQRVQWAAPEEVWEKLQDFMRPPAEVLSHLPVLDLTLAQRDLLQGRGVSPPAPEGVESGALFVARYEAALVAVLRREPAGISVARMFALG